MIWARKKGYEQEAGCTHDVLEIFPGAKEDQVLLRERELEPGTNSRKARSPSPGLAV